MESLPFAIRGRFFHEENVDIHTDGLDYVAESAPSCWGVGPVRKPVCQPWLVHKCKTKQLVTSRTIQGRGAAVLSGPRAKVSGNA